MFLSNKIDHELSPCRSQAVMIEPGDMIATLGGIGYL
jgi:hypothetical protein